MTFKAIKVHFASVQHNLYTYETAVYADVGKCVNIYTIHSDVTQEAL